MIDDFITAKALLDKAQAFAGAHSYRLAIQGAAFEPLPTETYLKETFLGNETDPLGISIDSSDRQDSIYQLDIYTPKANGKFSGLSIGNDIKEEFPRGLFVVNNAQQKVQISNISAVFTPSDKTHNRVSVTIDLIVLATNG